MLAPIDKQRTGVNDIIQIIVTTACTLQCSNCTQLLPFRKDYRHISLDVFRTAVRSLRDWPGVVGIFGGNPCNHPKFPELCEILVEEIPDQRHRGLWSNDLRQHGQIARATFYPHGRFNLNAHGVGPAAAVINGHLPGRLIPGSDTQQAAHSVILADYRDMGMSFEEFSAAREACDINRKWSGAIAERDGRAYAYFCEVAAAMDGVRGTNYGVEVFPGWWQHGMELFHHQVIECCNQGCGVPLKLKGHRDDEEIYDLSSRWQELHPTSMGQGVTTHLVEPGHPSIGENTDYMATRSNKGKV